MSDRQGLSRNLVNSYMINICAIDDVEKKALLFQFLLQHNHHKFDNQCDMSQDIVMQIDDNCTENHSDHANTINDGLCHVHVSPIESESFDISSKQDLLSKRFSIILLSQSDETENDLFHLIKLSNTPLFIFGPILNWD